MGLGPQDERVYDKLNKLLKTGQLRAFIDKHPAFTWSPKGQKGMLVTWAHGPQRPAVDDVPALEAGALEESVRTPGFASASGADRVTQAPSGDAATHTQAPQAPSFASASSAGPATKGNDARTYDPAD